MTVLRICLLVLLVAGIAPGAVLAAHGPPGHRLVGVELVGAVTVVAMMLSAQVVKQSYELIVPLVLVVLAFAGTLVFTRLIGRFDDDESPR